MKAYVRIVLFALWSLPLVTLQTLVLLVYRGPLSYKIPRLWHNGLCKVFGLKIKRVGHALDPRKQPVMFIANHISYLDILAMGSKLEASFVAKNDLATWPIFGYISTMQQTAFISRNPKDALKERNSLQSYLKAGKSIILFPEGTTGYGDHVLPFKSSLFALALDHHLTDGRLLIQPFTIRVVPKPGPEGKASADAYTWPFDDDTPMVTHLKRFANGIGCVLELIYHEPIKPSDYNDRKILCRLTQTMVTDGLKTGRSQGIPAIIEEQPEPETVT
jgi:lyso-ornithine lipid O-acyltransferase